MVRVRRLKWTLEAGGMELNVWAILLVAKSLRKVPRRIALLRFVSVLMMRVRISILSDRSCSTLVAILSERSTALCNGDISGRSMMAVLL